MVFAILHLSDQLSNASVMRFMLKSLEFSSSSLESNYHLMNELHEFKQEIDAAAILNFRGAILKFHTETSKLGLL